MRVKLKMYPLHNTAHLFFKIRKNQAQQCPTTISALDSSPPLQSSHNHGETHPPTALHAPVIAQRINPGNIRNLRLQGCQGAGRGGEGGVVI